MAEPQPTEPKPAAVDQKSTAAQALSGLPAPPPCPKVGGPADLPARRSPDQSRDAGGSSEAFAKEEASAKAGTIVDLASKIGEIHTLLSRRLAAESTGVIEFLQRPWKMIWMSLVTGLARGVGFFLGATVIGVLGVAIVLFVAKRTLGALGMDWDKGKAQETVKEFLNDYHEWRAFVEEHLKKIDRPAPSQDPAQSSSSSPSVPVSPEKPAGEESPPGGSQGMGNKR